MFEAVAEAAKFGQVGVIDPGTFGYVSEGGTYIIASRRVWNDYGIAHDLVAILPGALEGSRVLPLYVAVNPDLVSAIRAALGE